MESAETSACELPPSSISYYIPASMDSPTQNGQSHVNDKENSCLLRFYDDNGDGIDNNNNDKGEVGESSHEENGDDNDDDSGGGDDDDDDQMAFAAQAAAEALTENDHAAAAAASVLGDAASSSEDVILEVLKVVKDGESSVLPYESQPQQQQQQHLPVAPHATHRATVDFPPPITASTNQGVTYPVPAAFLDSNGHHPLVPNEQQLQQHRHYAMPLGNIHPEASHPGEAVARQLPPEPIEHPICCICGQGNEEGRPILRFVPVVHETGTANAAPGVVTFTQDILLHIFCGKTASILPSVNRPDLEILTKAGIKNKHGIGPEVNAALARTRSAMILVVEDDDEEEELLIKTTKKTGCSSSSVSNCQNKDKQFYLVREFEAHLAAIRRMQLTFNAEGGGLLASESFQEQQPNGADPFGTPAEFAAALGDVYDDGVVGDVPAIEYAMPPAEHARHHNHKPPPPVKKAQARHVHAKSKRYHRAAETAPSSSDEQHGLLLPHGSELRPDRKLKCKRKKL